MGLIYGRNQKWPSTFPSISLPYDLGFVIFQWEWVKKSSPRGPQILGYMFSINHLMATCVVHQLFFLGRYLRFTMTIEGILTNIFGIITIHSMNPFEPCKFHTWHAQLNSPRCPVAIQKWLPPRFSMDQATLFVQFRNKEVHGPSRLQDTRLQAFIKGCQTSCPATSSNAVGQVFHDSP